MKTISVTNARRRFGALLNNVQGEPVIIRRRNRDVAVIVSAEAYERMRGVSPVKFQRFLARMVAQKAFDEN